MTQNGQKILFLISFSMFFWIIYIFLSLVISFLFSRLTKRRLLKFAIFFLIFSLFSSVWFKNPGSSEIAPVISILLLENSILDSQGIMRLIRPLSLFALVGLFLSIIFWLIRSKS